MNHFFSPHVAHDIRNLYRSGVAERLQINYKSIMTFLALIYFYFVLFIFLETPFMEVMNFIANCHVLYDNKEVR